MNIEIIELIIIFQQVLSKLCLYQLYKPYITSGKTIPSVSLF